MKRIIIMVENRVGVIAEISEALATNDINIQTLDTKSVGDSGIVILTTNDPNKALHALKNAGFKAVSDDAIIIKLVDKPGALAIIAEKFKKANVNIRSMHILNCHNGYSMVALTTNDRENAQALIDREMIV